MFVGIEDYKGAIAVENILTPYKKGRLAPDKKTRLPKEPITPEVCMEVLRSTNYARNIKDMLECIADLPKAQQAQFKDVVLATFSNREQPSDVLFLGKKLAYVSGYTKEFYAVKELKAGDFIASAVKPAKSYLHLKGLGHLPEDLSEYEELVCRGGSPEFAYVKKMPKTLKFENCMTARLDANALEGVENIVCHKVDTLSLKGRQWYEKGGGEALKRLECADCDFITLENITFVQPPAVEFSGCNHLALRWLKNFSQPEVFDGMAYVMLNEIEFADIKKPLKFHNIDGLQIHKSYLPETVEFENVQSLVSNADFEATKTVNFNNMQKLDLSSAKNLPDVVVEGGKYVELNHAEFRSDSKVVLNDVTDTKMSYVKKMPKALTVAKCRRFEAYQTDFKDVGFLPQDVNELHLIGAVNLPSLTILANTEKLNIDSAAFADGQKLVLNGVKIVKATELKNAPDLIKITHADEVHLLLSDLQNTKKTVFSDVKNVWAGALSISGDFSAKNCQLVSFAHGGFEPQANLKFEQIDMADFTTCDKMPENLDVSKVKDLSFFSLKGVKQLVLRDEKQKGQIRNYVFDDFNGNLVYTSPDANKAKLDYRQELNDRFEAQREIARKQIEEKKNSSIWSRLFGKDGWAR